MSIYSRNDLGPCCRMITTSICCIPCLCEDSEARVTCCCTAQQVHRCSTAIINGSWCCEHWCSCTVYGSICTSVTDRRCMSIYSRNDLGPCCGMITTSICCIPGLCENSEARVTCCCTAQQVHCCSTAIIICCRCREVWCSCTIYGSICTGIADRRCMSIYCGNDLGFCRRMITTGICCMPCPSEYSQARIARCCVAQQVHCCTTAIIICCRCREYWCCCTIYGSICTGITDRRCMSIYSCNNLGSCCRMITTGICCIPCLGVNSQARVACSCTAQQVHCCSTAIIVFCWCCEYRCRCTIYGSICTCITNRRCMSINSCNNLGSCC